MDTKKLLHIILLALILLAVIALMFRIAHGVFSLLGSAVNAVLGIVLILVTLIIVVWMFYYAKKH